MPLATKVGLHQSLKISRAHFFQNADYNQNVVKVHQQDRIDEHYYMKIARRYAQFTNAVNHTWVNHSIHQIRKEKINWSLFVSLRKLFLISH